MAVDETGGDDDEDVGESFEDEVQSIPNLIGSHLVML
jgi:hypothetical protein